jgi:hypothetical protein
VVLVGRSAAVTACLTIGPQSYVSGGVDPRYFGGATRFLGNAAFSGDTGLSERRIGEIGVGAVLGRVVLCWIIPTYEFSGVVTLKRFGQVVEEVEERGDIVIAESQGQAYQRHIVRFHGGYRDRFCFCAARSAALAAAAS